MNSKKINILIISLLLLVSVSYAQKDPKTLKFYDIDYKPQRPQISEIKNGIKFYFKEDHEAPIINTYIIVKTGDLNDPVGKKGVAALTFALMKSGGTQKLTPEEVENKLDSYGSSLSSSSGTEFSRISLWTLSKNFNESWSILADMISNPRFDKDRFDMEKKKELESIRRRWDEPRSTGFILFEELIYGKDYPETKRTIKKDIESITLDDIKKFYAQNIKDRELVVAITGDFNPQKIATQLKKDFKQWNPRSAPKLNLPKAKLAARPGVYLIDKEDLTQGIICLGHLGINRLDVDNVEMNILNFIYGTGGFNSRLMREVRSNRGLAYSTFGVIGDGRDLGTFINFCQTKNQTVGLATKLILHILTDITKTKVSLGELETAKKYEQNAFVHKFNSSQAILLETVYLDLEGYPANYLDTYISRIKEVTREKILEMAKRTIHPNDIVILVVGKKAELIDQLKELKVGEIKELPLPKE